MVGFLENFVLNIFSFFSKFKVMLVCKKQAFMEVPHCYQNTTCLFRESFLVHPILQSQSAMPSMNSRTERSSCLTFLTKAHPNLKGYRIEIGCKVIEFDGWDQNVVQCIYIVLTLGHIAVQIWSWSAALHKSLCIVYG